MVDIIPHFRLDMILLFISIAQMGGSGKEGRSGEDEEEREEGKFGHWRLRYGSSRGNRRGEKEGLRGRMERGEEGSRGIK